MITCAIIDDEPWAVKLLENYVNKTESLKLSYTFSNAVEAMETLRTSPVDLLFCDIQMPDLNGLQFATMMADLPTRIIFTTAFSQYAVEGWKVEALDYLLKPISYSDFLNAVSKAQKFFDMARAAATVKESADTTADTATPAPAQENDSLFVKSDYKLIRIRFADILYIQGLKDYVKIYIKDERKPILSHTSMRTIENTMPAGSFLRTHRSFIVNMDQVTVMERGQIVFGDKYIPVSDSYKEQFQEYISKRTL